MTLLEDLKSGRLVVVQREAMADLCDAVMADVSEAKRRLDADIPKDAPVHPVSAFLTGTALHIGKARASPDHTAALIAMVEGIERERDMLVQTSAMLCDDCGWAMKFPDEGCVNCRVHAAEARALAAEAASLAKDERIAALEKVLDALIIESGGQAIPNTNLTIAREQAIRARSTARHDGKEPL